MFRTQEQDHIQELYNKRAKNDENSSTLAQTLETNIFTAFKGEHKFIFELLQNADDSASDERMIETNFVLRKITSNNRNYLVFTHSGAHFSKQDVEKICDNSQQYFQDKSANTKKIGYKGIGFKAVFSIADCVHIISNGYNFRFDQNYFLRIKEERKSYPWPIIPIQNQESDLLLELKDLIQKDRVTFILQIRSEIQIENELQFIKDNRTLMLFLRNIKSIALTDKTGTVKINVEREGYFKKFFINSTFVDTWLMHELLFDIPEHIHDFLKTLQDSECPQRLKAAKQTKITFAAQIDIGNKIISNLKNPLFCYLPTQVKCGFPYLVNADFLLNTERSRLVDNAWNEFVMLHIGYYQLAFLAELSKNQSYQLQIFKLLPGKMITGLSPSAEKGYNNGFEQGMKEIAFIPSLRNPKHLLKISEVIVDGTSFYCDINGFNFSEGVLISNEHEAIKEFLDIFGYNNKDNNVGTKIKKFITLDDLISHLPWLAQNYLNIEFQRYILNFLHECSKFNYPLSNQLRGRNFILSEKNKLFSPETIYLPSQDLLTISEFSELNLVHTNLLEFEPFFKKIGVRSATRIEFIRGTVQRLISENKISLDKILPITHLIFQANQAGELQREDWIFLKKLPIKTKKGILKKPHECYLSDVYQPKQMLEAALVDADIFISAEYIQLADNNKAWRSLFEKLGVKGEVKVRHTKRLLRKDAILEKSFINHYLNFLKEEGSSPQKSMAESEIAEHYIENFVDIDLIEYSSNLNFSDIFWERLLNAWQDIKTYSKDTHYHMSRKSNQIKTTYLQYCFQHAISILSNHPNPFRSRELFMPALYEVIGDALPVARINVPLTDEQATFFGFKTTLTVDDCLSILNYINRSEQKTNPSRYSPILKYLTKLTMTGSDAEKLKQWNGYLLAQNNTLQPVKALQYSSLMIELPKGPNWLKEFPQMHPEEIMKIAELFAIPVLGQEVVRISMTQENPEDSLLAKNSVLKKLPVIALIEANACNVQPGTILGMLQGKFECLTFVSAHRLSIEIKGITKPIKAYLQNTIFYFEKRHTQRSTSVEFCNKLSFYFGLSESTAQALHTFLYFDDEADLENYLIYKEIDPGNLPKLGIIKPLENKPPVSDELVHRLTVATEELLIKDKEEVQIIEQENVSRSKHLNERSTNSEIFANPKMMQSKFAEVEDFDIKAIKFEKAVLTKKNPVQIGFHSVFVDNPVHHENREENTLSQTERSRIGRLGERIVYMKLIDIYKDRYKDCKFEEMQRGFKLVGQFFNKKTQKTEALELEVIWYNKGLPDNQDMDESKDFTIVKNGAIRHIEVKATPSSDKSIFRISCREWEVMKEFANQYRIFRVFDTYSNNPRISKIKNPAKEIQEGNIEVKAYELKI